MAASAPETSRAQPEEQPGFQDWMPPFLELFEDSLAVAESAKAVGVSRVTVWRHLRKCPWFKAQWDALMTQYVLEPLRESVYRRAIHGTKREGPFGEWTEHETGLTKMVAERLLPELKAEPPERAGESGVLLVPGMLTEQEWAEVVARRKAGGTS